MMKNVSVKILAGVGVLTIAGGIYSFTAENNPEEKESKKYEVIRMVEGEMTTFDTIVPVSSDYTPQDYLNDLGFGDDENVSIVDITKFDPEQMMTMHHYEDGMNKKDGEKMIFIEMNDENVQISENGEKEIRFEKKIMKDEEGNVMIDDNGNIIKIDEDSDENVWVEKGDDGKEVKIRVEKNVEIDENGDVVDPDNDEDREVRIEKRIIINENGEETEDVEIDIDGMLENLNIDSMIQVALAMEGIEGDSHQVFVHKMIVTEEEFDGDGNFEYHEIDTDGASYHKEVHGPDHHMEVAVWGDEEEDFTLVIVSNPDETPSRSASIEEESTITDLKLFPNPANETTQLQLNFKKKANTAITITDVQGKTVAQMDLGKFKGQFNHDIDVKGWESGVYLIHITHGDEKLIEKLIVE